MANTGNIIVTERDNNPNSLTYNQTRTRTYQDTERCPIGSEPTYPIWVEISYSCERVDGEYSGFITVTEQDSNPNSSTYGQIRTRTYEDTTRCPTGEYKIKGYKYNIGRYEQYVLSCSAGTPFVVNKSNIQSIMGSTGRIMTMVIGTCVTSIAANTMENQYPQYLMSLFIPSTVTSIGDRAFAGCTDLREVSVAATTPPTLGTRVFYNTSSNMVIDVPAESVEAYKAAPGWSDYADKIQAGNF